MLFRKNHMKNCSYCLFCDIKKANKLICSKKGSVKEDDSCAQFQYDPCKRVPQKAKALDFKQFADDDFSL